MFSKLYSKSNNISKGDLFRLIMSILNSYTFMFCLKITTYEKNNSQTNRKLNLCIGTLRKEKSKERLERLEEERKKSIMDKVKARNQQE